MLIPHLTAECLKSKKKTTRIVVGSINLPLVFHSRLWHFDWVWMQQQVINYCRRHWPCRRTRSYNSFGFCFLILISYGKWVLNVAKLLLPFNLCVFITILLLNSNRPNDNHSTEKLTELDHEIKISCIDFKLLLSLNR